MYHLRLLSLVENTVRQWVTTETALTAINQPPFYGKFVSLLNFIIYNYQYHYFTFFLNFMALLNQILEKTLVCWCRSIITHGKKITVKRVWINKQRKNVKSQNRRLALMNSKQFHVLAPAFNQQQRLPHKVQGQNHHQLRRHHPRKNS